eukprot:TRINITY_DN12644_c3_g2_i2.p2 TRINITY_DN12644_c3_g2~~TRINITY_DN12644_c3_g2_i2.p2  ORF type:complete len:145 (+),score=11.33 TRINITY_DN12644_c3_g2_i2:1273-1707(+)
MGQPSFRSIPMTDIGNLTVSIIEIAATKQFVDQGIRPLECNVWFLQLSTSVIAIVICLHIGVDIICLHIGVDTLAHVALRFGALALPQHTGSSALDSRLVRSDEECVVRSMLSRISNFSGKLRVADVASCIAVPSASIPTRALS